MIIKIIRTEDKAPVGKVADAEMQFEDGPLAGLRLVGFAVWERRNHPDAFNVTFPARQYSVNGERRAFALLRPTGAIDDAQERVRALIIQAYKAYKAEGETPWPR